MGSGVGGRGPIRGVGDIVGRSLGVTLGVIDGVGVGESESSGVLVGDTLGVTLGLGFGVGVGVFVFELPFILIVGVGMLTPELKLKFESNVEPELILVFRLIGFVFTLLFLGEESRFSAQKSNAPTPSRARVPKIVRITVLAVFGGSGGGK